MTDRHSETAEMKGEGEGVEALRSGAYGGEHKGWRMPIASSKARTLTFKAVAVA